MGGGGAAEELIRVALCVEAEPGRRPEMTWVAVQLLRPAGAGEEGIGALGSDWRGDMQATR